MKCKDILAELILVVILLFLSMNFILASQGTYVWTKKIGGTTDDRGNAIATDSSGNVYIAGIFTGTVNFGADFSVTDTKTAAGGYDIFITKILANGIYGWTHRMGGPSQDNPHAIMTDPGGNVYLAGGFNDTVNFGADFGTTDIKTAAGSVDIYVTKINANGTYGWTKRIGGPSSDSGFGINTDNSGNIFVTGYFNGTVNFGADFGTTDTKTASYGVDSDIFMTRINADGSYGGTRRIGYISHDVGYGVVTDPLGNAFITGYFMDTVDFGADFGTTDTKTASGSEDIFITKINEIGTYGWTRRIGGVSSDYCYSITADSDGNIYITGEYWGAVNFGADFGVIDIKTIATAPDIFITRINSDGTYGWTRQMGGNDFDFGRGITTDTSGNVYVTGNFWDTIDFGADFGITDIKMPVGEADFFITRINPDGSYGWTKRMGGASADFGWSITTDATGNIYVTGNFEDTVNFGADFGIIDPKTSAGSRDVFMTKLTVLPPVFNGHDFNGNGSSDASVWRPSNGRWYIKGLAATSWGQAGDVPVNGDYNGNSTTDIAVWRPSNGRWYIQGLTSSAWGQAGDIPVPGNYNGDVAGTTDIAVWRPSNGRWYIISASGAVWGLAGDIPVPGDYNGDGITDIAVWRPSNGRWYIKGVAGAVWGQGGDIPVPGDYNGDGKTDMAVWRPSNGRWFIKGGAGAVWGQAGDIPAPGDYNGDGKTDIAVWRPSNGRWYIKGMAGYTWGMLGDVPLVR